MSSSELITIVPRLPPVIDGVGDYALSLARRLRDDFNVETRFIVADPASENCEHVEDFGVSPLRERTADELLGALSQDGQANLLLHYVGYGYARRGAPVWLVDGLKRWRKRDDGARLLTMFHEVYASGPVWTSSFWLSPLQKHLAARLARLSDACLTSRQSYAEILNELSRNKHDSIPALPVFSNIGEPEQTLPLLKDRQRRMVVFGGRSNRLRVYENSLAALERVCRALEIEEICDVGPPIGTPLSEVNGVRVVQLGQRPAAEISALLSDSVAGFFDYNTTFLAKSTIFAAYSAHRLIPISASCAGIQADGLEAGKHYWVADSHAKNLEASSGQAIADSAYAWYRNHNLSVHAELYAAKVYC